MTHTQQLYIVSVTLCKFTCFFFGVNINGLCKFYARLQVMEAEKQKAESGTLHQEKTQIFHAAESKVI